MYQLGQSLSYLFKCFLATCSNLGGSTTFQPPLYFSGFTLKAYIPDSSGAPLTCLSVRNSLLVYDANECVRCILIKGLSSLSYFPLRLLRLLPLVSAFLSISIDIFLSVSSKGREVCLLKLELWKVFLPLCRSPAVLMCSLFVIIILWQGYCSS